METWIMMIVLEKERDGDFSGNILEIDMTGFD